MKYLIPILSLLILLSGCAIQKPVIHELSEQEKHINKILAAKSNPCDTDNILYTNLLRDESERIYMRQDETICKELS